MTQRNEPSVGAFDFLGFGKTVKAVKTPDQLVKEALQGFTDAQATLEKAQAAIAEQKAEHEAEIAARQALLTEAEASHDHLGRVAERFKALLA
jgi:multidrug efflux pump subunit AcrA (membrane-fusion protein)